MTASSQPSSPPSFEEQASTLTALQTIYSALVREFVIEVTTCPVDVEFSPSPESVEHANAWFQQVDAQIQVHQLRQFLQTTSLANEAGLRHLLAHHLQKTEKAASDRDKTDFLLVQYFSLCAPSGGQLSALRHWFARARAATAGNPGMVEFAGVHPAVGNALPPSQRTAPQRCARAGAQAQVAERGPLLPALGHGGLCAV